MLKALRLGVMVARFFVERPPRLRVRKELLFPLDSSVFTLKYLRGVGSDSLDWLLLETVALK